MLKVANILKHVDVRVKNAAILALELPRLSVLQAMLEEFFSCKELHNQMLQMQVHQQMKILKREVAPPFSIVIRINHSILVAASVRGSDVLPITMSTVQ